VGHTKAPSFQSPGDQGTGDSIGVLNGGLGEVVVLDHHLGGEGSKLGTEQGVADRNWDALSDEVGASEIYSVMSRIPCRV